MYKYTHFIKQNIAPKGAKKIGIYNENGDRVSVISLGNLSPTSQTKLYSFGLVSDVHLHQTTPSWQANNKLDVALSHFENQRCAFCVQCGDLVNTGFWPTIDGTIQYNAGQFEVYNAICTKHNIPIYGVCGNHESYNKAITENLNELKTYTGIELNYSREYGNDLYVYLSQPQNTKPMADEALQWLYETLETNRNKRCFVFVHPDISSGNPLGAYSSNRLFDGWGTKTNVFKNLLKHYKNTILFHGHSHFLFECQELDEVANYNEIDGFKSVHIPSLSRPCAIIDGVRTIQDDKSQGYIVDVYDDCIVLNGMDFISDKPVPIGTYKIDTTLQTVEANTFTDSTGIIQPMGE